MGKILFLFTVLVLISYQVNAQWYPQKVELQVIYQRFFC